MDDKIKKENWIKNEEWFIEYEKIEKNEFTLMLFPLTYGKLIYEWIINCVILSI